MLVVSVGPYSPRFGHVTVNVHTRSLVTYVMQSCAGFLSFISNHDVKCIQLRNVLKRIFMNNSYHIQPKVPLSYTLFSHSLEHIPSMAITAGWGEPCRCRSYAFIQQWWAGASPDACCLWASASSSNFVSRWRQWDRSSTIGSIAGATADLPLQRHPCPAVGKG